MDGATEKNVTTALAMARVRALRTAALGLHKAVLDAERRRYERAHGPIGGPQQALRLVMNDAFFAWLRPLADFIVQADERLADDRPVQASDAAAFAEQLRSLLQLESAGETFKQEYPRVLQDVPEAVVLHGRAMQLINSN